MTAVVIACSRCYITFEDLKVNLMKQLDLITQKICPKYPRPAKFSDPGGDFSEDELKELIRKRDNELTETDLMCIFQGALPAMEIRCSFGNIN